MPVAFPHLRFALSQIRSILLRSRRGREPGVESPDRVVSSRENGQREV
jgi:hypothetical protein